MTPSPRRIADLLEEVHHHFANCACRTPPIFWTSLQDMISELRNPSEHYTPAYRAPTVPEIKSYRERHGTSLVDAKRILTKAAILDALDDPNCNVRSILRAAIHNSIL